ncbi:hypothetical protein BJV77DRAFT_1033048 [Russula vinacea]|jgi:hypothetical protein|nr:hypothetical protein BJV77DRAFT_1033048 [Russula vinacea]
MQPPNLPPPSKSSASMGVDDSGSGPGALDLIVKSDAKKSIVNYVVWGWSTMMLEDARSSPFILS